MKIDFDGVQAFVLVAELGGFNKAAEQLHITQTALTRRIQKLEAYLGLKLLDRTTRRVDLTAVGKEFLPKARHIVFEMTAAVERLKDTIAKEIALEFYKEAFAGTPPAELLRRERAKFTEDSLSTTCLSYLLYGHPTLKLTRKV